MDSEVIGAVGQHGLSTNGHKTLQGRRGDEGISDDLYKEVITPLTAEFSDPIVAPHWWSKPVENRKAFRVKTRINNTIWRQWYVHFVKGKETMIKFANPMLLADKYHSRVLAVIVEGHYWCRKHGAIRAQYSGWRKSRKRFESKITIENLVQSKDKQDDFIASPGNGMEDLVLSGMLNGFGDFKDLDHLDLSVELDLPDFFSNELAMSEPQVSQLSTSGSNGFAVHPPDFTNLHAGSSLVLPQVATTQLDTTSLNTLAAAANLSEYYGAIRPPDYIPSPHGQYPTHQPPPPRGTPAYPGSHNQPQTYDYSSRGTVLGYSARPRQYSGLEARQSEPPLDSRLPPPPPQPPLPQELTPPLADPVHVDYTMTHTVPSCHSFMTASMPAPKGPAYYPPTRLQFCYTGKGPPYDHAVPFPQPHPTVTLKQEPPTPPYKNKLTEVEIDRKRRRAMKDRLSRLKDCLLPASGGACTKYTHATVLNRTADHLTSEEGVLAAVESDIVKLNHQIDQVRSGIAAHQSQIPDNGISSACFGSAIVEEEYGAFVRNQTTLSPLMNLYSGLLQPLFSSFNSMVDNTSLDSFCRTAHQWFAQNCSLVRLRELATNLVTSPNLEFEGKGQTGPSGV